MQDHFTGQLTRIQGRLLPGAEARRDLQYDHERRLAALDRVGAAATECGLRADSDRDLVLLAEDEVSLLEATGDEWARFGAAIRDLRGLLPLRSLEDFGFPGTPLAETEGEAAANPLEESNARLRRIGGGVEALAGVRAPIRPERVPGSQRSTTSCSLNRIRSVTFDQLYGMKAGV